MIYNILIIEQVELKKDILKVIWELADKISIVEPDVNKQKNLNSEFEIQHTLVLLMKLIKILI